MPVLTLTLTLRVVRIADAEGGTPVSCWVQRWLLRQSNWPSARANLYRLVFN